MPKATTKSEPNPQDKPKSSFDVALDTFIESGHFTLNNEIVTAEMLTYFREYLKKQAKPCSEQNYKLYLRNVTFNVELTALYSQEDRLKASVGALLDQFFGFSPKWGVIVLDNVTISQGDNRYLLSSYFIAGLLSQLGVMKDYLTELSIMKAEFHLWAWIRFLTIPPRLDSLTLELPNENEDKEDNLIVLCDALQYAKIKTLNLGASEISVQGYHALNELLDKNYFIEKMQLKEPTDPESQAIFKKINERLAEGRTGKQRFDIEKFNQAEFLRLLLKAQSALQHETDDRKISKLKKEIKFLLDQKWPFSIANRKNLLYAAPEVHVVYFNHAEYIQARLSLFRLDLNLLVNNGTRTLGHCLLENALKLDDTFMVSCLIDAGANLFEQRDAEKPFLMQVFEKNQDFKILILNHIFYFQTLLRTAERVLCNYPDSKKIIMEMGRSVIQYAKILKKRACPYLLSDFEKLLSLLKDLAGLSRPSRQRDKEFIEIYFRLFKCLILLDNSLGKLTVESISNVQTIMDEIIAISENAERGLKGGSLLHEDVINRSILLKQDMGKIKQLIAKDNALYEIEAVAKEFETSTLNEAGPSGVFFPRP